MLQLAGPSSALNLVLSPQTPSVLAVLPLPHPILPLQAWFTQSVTPPVSGFRTQTLDGKWKIPSALVLSSWLQGPMQGSPWVEC